MKASGKMEYLQPGPPDFLQACIWEVLFVRQSIGSIGLKSSEPIAGFKWGSLALYAPLFFPHCLKKRIDKCTVRLGRPIKISYSPVEDSRINDCCVDC
jgi:hypothetical protein